MPPRTFKSRLIFVSFLSFLVIYFYFNLFRETQVFEFPQMYFVELHKTKDLAYVVNTSTCKLPNMSLWATPYSDPVESKIPKSCVSNRAWTYTNGSDIAINETALKESGFSVQTVRCCYKVITRVEQSLQNYDKYADSTTITSEDCKVLKNVKTKIPEEFILVQCISKVWPMLGDVLYHQYHALFQPEKNAKTTSKINRWKNIEKEAPPNVFILGIDSMSNANFGRTMPKTKQVLKDLGALEIPSYTKVGYNTFPNVVPGLTGYSVEDLKEICFYTDYTAQDDCPYIWKRFEAAGYVTAHLEDVPIFNFLNFQKTGFVKQQVDYYLRPFMYTVCAKEFSEYYDNPECIGSKTTDQTVLDYVESMFEDSPTVPLFVFTWMTALAHADMNKPKFFDEIYENFLKRLNLNNTILFFIGDHGNHAQRILNGWYEERIPNFWVYLPPKLQKKYPSWMKNVVINSGRVCSPFDLYHSLNHVLQEFSNLPPVVDPFNRRNEVVRRKYGQSIFLEIPDNRTCADAGIGDEYCACTIPVKINSDRADVRMAVEIAIGQINKMVPPQCSKVHLTKIFAAGARERAIQTEFVHLALYTVVFFVDPGHFLFEATLEYRSDVKNFIVKGNVARANPMKTDRSCINDDELERYCYCL